MSTVQAPHHAPRVMVQHGRYPRLPLMLWMGALVWGCSSPGESKESGGTAATCGALSEACPLNDAGGEPLGERDANVSPGGDADAASDAGTEPAAEAGAPVVGCSTADHCASGACGAENDCTSCLGDDECSEGKVCGTFACAPACGGSSPVCGAGTACCGTQCVDITRDIQHCGGCNVACSATQFCGSAGCTEVSLGNVCQNLRGTVILNGLGGDDAESALLVPELERACSMEVRSVGQTATDVLHPETGQPFAGGNDLLVAVGGTFGHHLVTYLEAERIAPIYAEFVAGTPDAFEYRQSESNALVVSAPVASETETAGHFLIEVVRDPVSGSLVLVAYGYRAGGTAAAAWFLAHRVLPELSMFTDTWYLYRWTSSNLDTRPDVNDTFTFVAAGR